jgi:hypothetical protein
VDGKARLMGAGDMVASIRLPLYEPNERFYFSGILRSFHITSLNAMTETNAKVKVFSGKASYTGFSASADKYASRGQMRLLYDNLKIEILKYDEKNEKVRQRTHSRSCAREEKPEGNTS